MNEYHPSTVSHPMLTVIELIAEKLKIAENDVTILARLIADFEAIERPHARILAKFGPSVQFWLNLQENYQRALDRLNEKQRRETQRRRNLARRRRAPSPPPKP